MCIRDRGNGVCLIGNSEVFDRIRGKAQAEFAQIFTRVKMPRQYLSLIHI